MLSQFFKFLIFQMLIWVSTARSKGTNANTTSKKKKRGGLGGGVCPPSKNSQKDPKRSKAAYSPLRLTCKNDTKKDAKMKQNNCENIFQIEAKIDPKWRVWGITLGGRGGHFGRILEAWVASGCQMSLGRRFGRIFSDFFNFSIFFKFL